MVFAVFRVMEFVLLSRIVATVTCSDFEVGIVGGFERVDFVGNSDFFETTELNFLHVSFRSVFCFDVYYWLEGVFFELSLLCLFEGFF